jgi:MFS transporter, DHA2 family, multidrug resistance protein
LGFKEMLLPFAVRDIAVPFAMASTVTLTMGNLPPDRLKSASGLFALMRNLGGAIGVAVSASVVNDRTNLHFLPIAEYLNLSNTELAGWLPRMTSHYLQAWGDPMIGQTAALKKLGKAAYRKAQVQDRCLPRDCGLLSISAMMVPTMRGVTPK